MAEAVIGAVVGKLVDYSVDPIKKQLKYLCCFSCNVQKLHDEIQELNMKKRSEEERVNQSLANNEVITPIVENWLKKVEDLKTRSENILADAEEEEEANVIKSKKWLRLPFLHYFLSRKALKTANECIQYRNMEFSTIANPRILADIPDITPTSTITFETRVFIEDGILKALKDPNVHSIGIWGIGGVGKTVMAKAIQKRVRDEKIFGRVVMVTVSQQLDIPKMQRHIAEELGLKFKGDSLDSQTKQLHQRLSTEMSLLIIFDDLWERLDLEEFGIPSPCKLILTSRNHDALTSSCIPLTNIFELGILNEIESWKFFVDNLGFNIVDDDDDDEFIQIAKKVEKECKRLPLALKMVAFALKGKGKDKSFWSNAVRELERHAPVNIPNVTNNVYGLLLLSINALEGKEQKDLFFLCCLFPEDYLISDEELLRFGIGLGIFKELENLEEARDKVKTILNILLSRSLLIKGDDQEGSEDFNVRMHDVIRDVGIWMMETKGTKEHKFLIKHGLDEWRNDSLNNYTCISFLFTNPSISFPAESIVCPKLELLRLDFSTKYELPKNFFSEMGGIRVLEAFQIHLLPPSMSELFNLRTLSLQRCSISETTWVLGKLINLEILTLRKCDFEVLSIEIGDLKNLKQMNILECTKLRRIAYGVLSKLVRLEELVILCSFDQWMAEVPDHKGKDVACLSELNYLERLTTLKIEIGNSSVVPIEKPLWVQRVKKYAIMERQYMLNDNVTYFQKSIIFEDIVVLQHWIYDMASDVEYIELAG